MDSDVCSFCNFSREDLEHLLFVCPASQIFGNDIRVFWYDVRKEDIILSLKDVIVGLSGNIRVLLNYCNLVGKSLIYHCRRNNAKPIPAFVKEKVVNICICFVNMCVRRKFPQYSPDFLCLMSINNKDGKKLNAFSPHCSISRVAQP